MSGSGAARRVAFKNAARNRKRTFYLVLLIAVPVMVAVVTSSVVRLGRLTPEEQLASEFASGNVWVETGGTSAEVEAWLDDQIEVLAPDAEQLSFRQRGVLFGTREFSLLTDLDLANPLSGELLRLVDGRVPTVAKEIVLTEYIANALGVGVGDEIDLGRVDRHGLDPEGWMVVGLASHPVLYKSRLAVVAPETFDGSRVEYGDRRILKVGDDQQFSLNLAVAWEEARYDFYPDHVEWPMPDWAWFLDPSGYASMTPEELEEAQRLSREGDEGAIHDYVYEVVYSDGDYQQLPYVHPQSRTDSAMFSHESVTGSGPVVGSAVAAVILAEVGFIAGAAFATGTRRRLREIGLMGANGASDKHVRATVLGEGLVVGLLGGLIGSFLAFLAVTIGRSTVQSFVDKRIGAFPFSVQDLVGPTLIAVIACLLAAWVPARTASGVPTLTALQGRMPVSAPKKWIIPVGVGLGAVGSLLVGVGLASNTDSGSVVTVLGVVLMIGGAALLAGPLVAWIAGHSERFPVTPRIVLRDSGRQRGRAAAAVAATMVIVMAPVVALTTLEQQTAESSMRGISPDTPQLIVEGRYSEDSGELEPYLDSDLEAIRQVLPGTQIVEFEVIDAPVEYPGEVAAQKEGDGLEEYYIRPWRVAVANVDLVAFLNDESLVETLAEDGMALLGIEDQQATIRIGGQETTVRELPVAVQEWSFPRLLVTEETASLLNGNPTQRFAVVTVEQTFVDRMSFWASPFQEVWLLDLPLSLAGGGDGVSPTLLAAMFLVATMLVVLIVVATVTALSAAESDEELRTVVAVGAVNSIRRKYLGLQSGLHTLLGVLLSIPLTLLLMKSFYSVDLYGGPRVFNFGTFDYSVLRIPWTGIGILLFGLPLAIGLITALAVRSAPTTPPRRAT